MYEEIDPDGDLEIAVVPSSEPFAFWDEARIWVDADHPVTDNEDGPDDGDDGEEDDVGQDEGAEEGADEGIEDEPMTDIEDQAASDDSSAEERESGRSATPPEAEEYKFKVSSKHLRLASGRFKRMLSGNWVEAEVQPDGMRRVRMEGFNPKAFRIVMLVLHGKSQGVPRQVSLSTLAKIGVISDDLDCYEALAFAAPTWLAAFNRDLIYDPETDTCDRRLVLWIFVSYVFRSESLFRSATRAAMLTSRGPVPTLDLPLSLRIVEEMDNQRRNMIDWICNAANQIVSDICNERVGCSVACRSMLLGAFSLQAQAILVNPRPRGSCYEYSLGSLIETVRSCTTPEWYHRSGYTRSHTRKCNLETLISKKFNWLLDYSAVQGLALPPVAERRR